MLSLVDGIQNSDFWGRNLAWTYTLAEDPVRPTLVEQDNWGHNHSNPGHYTQCVMCTRCIEDVEARSARRDVRHDIWIETGK